METGISHSRDEESFEAKARWFRALSMEERARLLCEFTDLALALNPDLLETSYVEPVGDRIQVIERP